MPPGTKTRVTKVPKENIDAVKKNKHKSDGRITKPPRKALADKTNSLSDDNASIDIPIKTSKKALKSHTVKSNKDDHVRPRRERRLPPRYVENQMLKNLSNSKDSPVKQSPVNSKVEKLLKKSENSLPNEALPRNIKILPIIPDASSTVSSIKALSKDEEKHSKFDKPAKKANKLLSTNEIHCKNERITAATRPRRNCRLESAIEMPVLKNSSLNGTSPFKTPPKDLESSLVVNRPKRICRLPSKFEDHSISPNKFIPVQPCHASTPLLQKNTKTANKHAQSDNMNKNEKVAKTSGKGKPADKPLSKTMKKSKHTITKPNSSNSSVDKSSPDSNNNGKTKTVKNAKPTNKLQTKQPNSEANKITPFAKRLLDKSVSFRLLDDKKQSNNLDVYEFTFDPDEEPPPKKKKRKRTVKKKAAKPKVVVLKNNYNDNVTKALANLKSKIKPSQGVESNVKPPENYVNPVESVQSTHAIAKPVNNEIPPSNTSVSITTAMPPVTESATSIHESNYASIRVEDIAAEFDLSDHHNDIDYSPVNSPTHKPTPEIPEVNESHINPLLNKDPLNLQEDLSFFNEHPVASSSMNISVRHPLASPWRVEFGNLPMKWHSNTYVKSNMTPAVESSFINSEDMAKKKHVYTNMVPEEPLPEIIDSSAPNLKQPSIISFMREVAERSANKKKRRRSSSHENGHYIFDDITKTSNEIGYNTPKKTKKTAKDSTPNISSNSNDRSNEKENLNQSTAESVSPDKARKKKNKDCSYFGFDDSEDVDQENVSPVKIVPNTRTRGLRSRPVLKEFNAQAGPSRAVIPVAAKSKLTSSEAVEQLYDQLKSAEDAPQLSEKEISKELVDNTVTTNIDDPSWHEHEDDSQSVHLFEDIELVHHFKPHRKSYGKAKKVTFQQQLDSDSDSQPPVTAAPDYSSDDELDLTFQMPNVKPKKTIKKKKPKKQLTKKEEKAVEEWAAGFNSMCEDIEDFPLVVE